MRQAPPHARPHGEDVVLAAVVDAVRVVLELDPAVPITPASRLGPDLGADSIAIVEIAEVLEQAGLLITDADLVHVETIGDVADHVLPRPDKGS